MSIANSWSLLKLMSIELVMPSNHLLLCHPLLLQPSIFPSIRVLSEESALRIRWPKYWSFSFSTNPSNEYSGLVSFRMDWLDVLTVQGTLKSLLQHHSSKASILRCSTFFIVQLSHPYVPIGKAIALTRRTFVGKVNSLSVSLKKTASWTYILLERKSLWGRGPASFESVFLAPGPLQSSSSGCLLRGLQWVSCAENLKSGTDIPQDVRAWVRQARPRVEIVQNKSHFFFFLLKEK